MCAIGKSTSLIASININNKILVMKVKLIAIYVAALSLIIACNNANNQKPEANKQDNVKAETMKESIYDKAGVIKLHDPKSVMVGYRKAGEDIFEISLNDVGKYTGHVCAGVSSGYLLTKQALTLLYPDKEIPIRGQISIAASAYTDHAEVASYIIRARQTEGDEKEPNILVVDKTIKAAPKSVVLIFKRNDNGKMVKAIFDKSKMVRGEKMKEMMALKKKIMSKEASKEEKEQFAENVQKVVAKIINNTPEGLLRVESCTDYKFPE